MIEGGEIQYPQSAWRKLEARPHVIKRWKTQCLEDKGSILFLSEAGCGYVYYIYYLVFVYILMQFFSCHWSCGVGARRFWVRRKKAQIMLLLRLPHPLISLVAKANAMFSWRIILSYDNGNPCPSKVKENINHQSIYVMSRRCLVKKFLQPVDAVSKINGCYKIAQKTYFIGKKEKYLFKRIVGWLI